MAKSHVADITECEVLTDEILKSARTFIGNAIKWDSGAYRPVADALHKRLLDEIYKAEYDNEYYTRYNVQMQQTLTNTAMKLHIVRPTN